MPTRNALATARLSYSHRGRKAPYHASIQARSHSYDHPDPARRSALVTGVFLTQLPPSTGYAVSNVAITDRYGVDHTVLWIRTSGAQEEGFEGYTEYDTGGACGPGLPSVFWGSFSGIYDERCLADPGDSSWATSAGTGAIRRSGVRHCRTRNSSSSFRRPYWALPPQLLPHRPRLPVHFHPSGGINETAHLYPGPCRSLRHVARV